MRILGVIDHTIDTKPEMLKVINSILLVANTLLDGYTEYWHHAR